MIGRGLLALALLSNCGKEIIIVFILIKLICSLSLFGSDARAEAAFRRCFRRSSAPRTAAHPHLGSRPKMERVHLHLRQIPNPVTVFVTSRCDDSCFVISLFLSLSLCLSSAVLSLPVTSSQLENEDAKVRVLLPGRTQFFLLLFFLQRWIVKMNQKMKFHLFSFIFHAKKHPSEGYNSVYMGRV